MEHAPSLYTQQRDIWDVGVLLLQMILGLNVMEMYPTVGDAIEALDTCKSPIITQIGYWTELIS